MEDEFVSVRKAYIEQLERDNSQLRFEIDESELENKRLQNELRYKLIIRKYSTPTQIEWDRLNNRESSYSEIDLHNLYVPLGMLQSGNKILVMGEKFPLKIFDVILDMETTTAYISVF